jgi:hypothetical protein
MNNFILPRLVFSYHLVDVIVGTEHTVLKLGKGGFFN